MKSKLKVLMMVIAPILLIIDILNRHQLAEDNAYYKLRFERSEEWIKNKLSASQLEAYSYTIEDNADEYRKMREVKVLAPTYMVLIMKELFRFLSKLGRR